MTGSPEMPARANPLGTKYISFWSHRQWLFREGWEDALGGRRVQSLAGSLSATPPVGAVMALRGQVARPVVLHGSRGASLSRL